MKMPELVEHKITIKVTDRQFEFLENRAEELGLSKEELVKLCSAEAVDEEQQISQEKRLAKILNVKTNILPFLRAATSLLNASMKRSKWRDESNLRSGRLYNYRIF